MFKDRANSLSQDIKKTAKSFAKCTFSWLVGAQPSQPQAIYIVNQQLCQDDKSQCCLAGDIFQCCLMGDKVYNFTMNLSSDDPQPIFSIMGQHFLLSSFLSTIMDIHYTTQLVIDGFSKLTNLSTHLSWRTQWYTITHGLLTVSSIACPDLIGQQVVRMFVCLLWKLLHHNRPMELSNQQRDCRLCQ